MDDIDIDTPLLSKRPCCSSPDLIAKPLFKLPKLDNMDNLLQSFLDLSDSSDSFSLDMSFDRLIQSRECDADQNELIERAMRLGNVLLEAGKRSARKRASVHNSLVWALPSDLTIKIFSMLDTQSVCYASATCSFFHKCAMDPLCYANIDLTTVVPKVSNVVVSTMIQRAGILLQSLKLGIVPSPTASYSVCQPWVYTIRNPIDASGFSWNDKRSRQGRETSILTRSCLISLSAENGTPGALLKTLHLYNIERMDNLALCTALEACPSIRDLEIVGLHVELRQTLDSVSKNCQLVERLFFESSKTGRDDSLKGPICSDLINNCPHLTSLALRGFKLHDQICGRLLKGLRKLKFLDFSTSYSITGQFLRIGSCARRSPLEVLVLRDCMNLREAEVGHFAKALLSGDYKFLNHLDISNREGLAREGDWYNRCYSTSFIPIKRLLEERPGFCFQAEFPPEGSFVEIEQMIGMEAYNSDFSLSSGPKSQESDGSTSMSFTESSYNSDQSSGNEDNRDSMIYDESSDDVV
ncbi:F-box protein SKIP17-like [Impatiens glandulifera]|uniref:F-box protein SKIP17-like n=1 Tax=Impatiens glandulifera TaxID=253017 RepID=UPI001FB10FD7|nr:F-box protein SKIP17-like [Impatiens glandulifera]